VGGLLMLCPGCHRMVCFLESGRGDSTFHSLLSHYHDQSSLGHQRLAVLELCTDKHGTDFDKTEVIRAHHRGRAV
jgi:hypothetical protein